MDIRQAVEEDAEAITALIAENSVDRGGRISREFAGVQVRAGLAGTMPVIVAALGADIVGVLFTSDRENAVSPSVAAMLRAWPGADDAYVYGPVCVAESHRGQGILRKLFDEVKRRLPGREAVLFIQKSNDVSRAAHSKLGMRQVAQFAHNGEDFLVFSAR